MRKYWKNDEQGCKRDKACKYLQNNQSIKVDGINTECVDMQIVVMDSMDENVVENADEVLKIGELETLIAFKDKQSKSSEKQKLISNWTIKLIKNRLKNVKELRVTCTKSYLR